MLIGRRRGFNSTRRDKDNSPGIQMYADAPTNTVSFLDLYALANERMKVLQEVEELVREHESDKWSEVTQSTFRLRLRKVSHHLSMLQNKDTPCVGDLSWRQKDLISHYILRLSFCRTPEMRQWLVQQESDLFKYRFLADETSATIRAFIAESNLPYTMLEEIELKNDPDVELYNQLASFHLGKDTVIMYKVPFYEAFDLVKKRRVVVRQGMAYVPKNDLVTILTGKLRTSLSQSLAKMTRYYGRAVEDERMAKLLQKISNPRLVTANKDYGNTDNKVTPEMLDELCITSYPPCMRRLHEHLRKEHHMKHGGRLQYGLFLKGIGLNLDDAMRFWSQEFTKNMDLDKFEKQYSYNIRYNYGKEGKKISYSPASCIKIITSNPPGPLDAHGCVFKHSDEQHIGEILRKFKLTESQSGNIAGLWKDGNCQSACTRLFEYSHGLPEGTANTIAHPNQYFEQSRAIITGVAPSSQFGDESQSGPKSEPITPMDH